jgi:glycerophosphoryl diester phosphodiesterase
VIPTLEEVFTAFPAIPLNVEIKQAEPSITEPLCRLIRDHGLADQVLVASFDQSVIDEFRRECPEVASTAGETEVTLLFVLSKVGFARLHRPAAQAVQVPEHRSGYHVLVPSFVDAAHRRNLEVHAWTINDTEDMRRLSALGIDGIITDYPDRLMELVGR